MNQGIFIRDGDSLVPMSESPYEAEAVLQALLADFPELLVGGGSGEPPRYLLIDRELDVSIAGASTRRGYVDHIFVDEKGIPTIIEVKRSSNPEIRREIVGQMLDYAANLVAAWGVDGLRERFERRCGDSSEAVFQDALPELTEPEEFWKQVSTNMEVGRYRLVFVADAIPPELRRIIEFLNSQMTQTEVLAIEVKQYLDDDSARQTYVASVVGQTEAARQVKGERGRAWDKDSFLAEVAKVGDPAKVSANRILTWAESRADLKTAWGSGMKDGSFQFGHYHPGYLWPLVIYTYGRVEVQFMHMLKRPPFDVESRRVELRSRLEAIKGLALNSEAVDKRPSFALDAVAGLEEFEELVRTLDWAFDLADAAAKA